MLRSLICATSEAAAAHTGAMKRMWLSHTHSGGCSGVHLCNTRAIRVYLMLGGAGASSREDAWQSHATRLKKCGTWVVTGEGAGAAQGGDGAEAGTPAAPHAELAEHFALAVKRLEAVGVTQLMGEDKVPRKHSSTL